MVIIHQCHQLAKRLVHRFGRCKQITNQLVGSHSTDTQEDGSLFAGVVHIVRCKVVLQSFTVQYPIFLAVIILADGSVCRHGQKFDLDLMRPQVGSRVHANQFRQKMAHDQRARNRSFELGDTVFIKTLQTGLPGYQG